VAPDWYLKDCEEQLRTLREMLEPLESGKLRLGSRSADQPEWVDATEAQIAHMKRNIAMFERIIERLKESG